MIGDGQVGNLPELLIDERDGGTRASAINVRIVSLPVEAQNDGRRFAAAA